MSSTILPDRASLGEHGSEDEREFNSAMREARKLARSEGMHELEATLKLAQKLAHKGALSRNALALWLTGELVHMGRLSAGQLIKRAEHGNHVARTAIEILGRFQ